MIAYPAKEFFINKFVDVKLPTKRQLFSRLGASASGSHYSGDESVDFDLKPTEMADALVNAAENYQQEKPSDDGAAD